MTRVLITGISGDIGLSALQIIRRTFPDWGICGSDLHSESPGAALVDRFLPSVPSTDASYLSWIKEAVEHHGIHLVVPCSEPEIQFFALNDHALSIPVVIANAKSIDIGSDKLTTAIVLSEAGLPVPQTSPAVDMWKGHYPHIVKPRDGRGSRGIFLSQDPNEDAQYRSLFPNSVFQELLSPVDQEITCAIYRTQENNSAVIALRRRLNGGSTSWCEVVNYPEVHELCQQIATILDLQGSINIQLIRTPQGPMVFEINPRFSSTLDMRDQLGFHDLKWSIEETYLHERPSIRNVVSQGIAFKVPSTQISTSGLQVD